MNQLEQVREQCAQAAEKMKCHVLHEGRLSYSGDVAEAICALQLPEITQDNEIRARLVANMVRFTSSTKRQAKAIVDGCFDGEGAISKNDLIKEDTLTEITLKPVAWWNKSVGGFYLNKDHIKEYEKNSHNIVELYALSPDAEALINENHQLRELLCFSSTHIPYVDDGELQDNSKIPFIDYKRDSIDTIKAKLTDRTFRELKGGGA